MSFCPAATHHYCLYSNTVHTKQEAKKKLQTRVKPITENEALSIMSWLDLTTSNGILFVG